MFDPYDIIDEITKIFQNNEKIQEYDPIIKKNIDLKELKDSQNNRELPPQTIITTYWHDYKAEKPHFMSVLKDIDPLIVTEVFCIDPDYSEAEKKVGKLSLLIEKEIEKHKTLNGTVRENFVSNIQRLGVNKHSPNKFEGRKRIYYKFTFFR